MLIKNLQNGVFELEGNSYALSSGERDFLNENFDPSITYNKWSSDLYIKEDGLDIFPLLLIRPFFSICSRILSSYGIPTKVKGVETSKLIHSFLDSSSINSSNSRLVILLPIYCALNQVLSGFDLVVHSRLLNQILLRILDGSPKSYRLSEIVYANSTELITSHVQDALIKEGSEISSYIESLDLELDKKERHSKLDFYMSLPYSSRR